MSELTTGPLPYLEEQIFENSKHLTRVDAATASVFERELESIDPRVWDTLKAPLLYSRFLSVSNGGLSPVDQVYTWTIQERTGQAKLGSFQETDIPFADVEGKETSRKVYNGLMGYTYDIHEQQASPQLRINRLEQKRLGARFGLNKLFDDVLAVGSARHGFTGLINDASVATAAVSTLTGGTGSWASASLDAIIEDVRVIKNEIVTGLKDADMDPDEGGALAPNSVILPSSVWSLLEKYDSTARATVREVIQKAHPDITNWYKSNRLDTAGAGTGTRLIMYNDNPMNVEGILPVPYQELAPQQDMFRFKVPAYGRIVGTVFHRPFTAYYADGV